MKQSVIFIICSVLVLFPGCSKDSGNSSLESFGPVEYNGTDIAGMWYGNYGEDYLIGIVKDNLTGGMEMIEFNVCGSFGRISYSDGTLSISDFHATIVPSSGYPLEINDDGTLRPATYGLFSGRGILSDENTIFWDDDNVEMKRITSTDGFEWPDFKKPDISEKDLIGVWESEDYQQYDGFTTIEFKQDGTWTKFNKTYTWGGSYFIDQFGLHLRDVVKDTWPEPEDTWLESIYYDVSVGYGTELVLYSASSYEGEAPGEFYNEHYYRVDE